MSDTYAKLASKIVYSSVWQYDDHTRLVWITMLALKGADQRVVASVPGLAHMARVPLESCEKALDILSKPDPYSSSKEDEGRRIRRLNDGSGWFIVNGAKYQLYGLSEIKKQQVRERMARYRDRSELAAENSSDALLRTVTQSYAPLRSAGDTYTETETEKRGISGLGTSDEAAAVAANPPLSKKAEEGEIRAPLPTSTQPPLSGIALIHAEERLKRIEEAIEKLRGECGEDAFGKNMGSTQQKATLKLLKAQRKEVCAQLGYPA